MMNKGYVHVLIVMTVFTVSAMALYSIFRSPREDKSPSVTIYPTAPTSTPESSSLSNAIVAPSGWIVTKTSPSLLLTRSDHMSLPTGTELYAYGTFMLVERVPMRGERREEWIAARLPPADDPLVVSREWVRYAGRDMYKAVQQAAGAEGEEISYYYFIDTEAMIFSLYPFKIEGMLNEQGVADLEQVAEVYIGQH